MNRILDIVPNDAIHRIPIRVIKAVYTRKLSKDKSTTILRGKKPTQLIKC